MIRRFSFYCACCALNSPGGRFRDVIMVFISESGCGGLPRLVFFTALGAAHLAKASIKLFSSKLEELPACFFCSHSRAPAAQNLARQPAGKTALFITILSSITPSSRLRQIARTHLEKLCGSSRKWHFKTSQKYVTAVRLKSPCSHRMTKFKSRVLMVLWLNVLKSSLLATCFGLFSAGFSNSLWLEKKEMAKLATAEPKKAD